jgi:hypothetical protein
MRPPALVVGNCRMWGEHGELLGINRPTELRLVELLMPENEDLLPLNPAQYLYHRSLHHAIGPYAVDEHFAMDIDFVFRAAAVARLRHVDEVWGNYRYLPEAKTARDVASGEAAPRLARLRAAHVSRLPAHRRLELAVRRAWRRRRKPSPAGADL